MRRGRHIYGGQLSHGQFPGPNQGGPPPLITILILFMGGPLPLILVKAFLHPPHLMSVGGPSTSLAVFTLLFLLLSLVGVVHVNLLM
jgi:hypothetical protein